MKNRQIQVHFENGGAKIMSNEKRTYTKQFKAEAIALWEASEKLASAIAQELKRENARLQQEREILKKQ